MDENRLRFGVGVLVISAIGIGIILTFLFGAFPSVLNRDYSLLVDFPSAEGISTNTKVYRDGVHIGRVTNIDLLPEGGVRVGLAIDSRYQLTRSFVPRIGTSNFVTGDAEIEFVKASIEKIDEIAQGDPARLSQQYGDGDYLKFGEKTTSLFEMQSDLATTFEAIRQAGDSIEGAGASVDNLATDLRMALGNDGENVKEMADQAREAVKALQEFVQNMNDIVGDQEVKEGLRDAIAGFPELITSLNSTVQSADRTLDSVKQTSDQIREVGEVAEDVVKSAQVTVEKTGDSLIRTLDTAEKTLGNVEQFTRPFAARGDEFAEQLITSLANLDRSLVQVEAFTKTLNSSNGSFRRFLEDDELYYQVRRTLQNIEEASAKVRPILDDVRVFSDKVARDPRQLGVRGAITRRPSGSGLK